MKINFTKEGTIYVATFVSTSDFQLIKKCNYKNEE